MNKRLSREELAKMAAEARGRTSTLPPPLTPEQASLGTTSVIRLRVADVRAYENNPRQDVNPQKAEIKESIAQRGLDAMLTVTKRPGQEHYILAKGGKTRLECLQELDAETPKGRFEHMDFLLVPFKSEVEILVAHMVENIQRADMSFWDTAVGTVAMKSELETTLGRSLSLREFSDELKKNGIVISRDMVNDYEYAVAHLAPLKNAGKLDRSDVRRVLRPGMTVLKAIWLKHAGRQEEDFALAYRGAVTDFDVQGLDYSAEALSQHITELIAQELNYLPADFQLMIEGYRLNPSSSLEELKRPQMQGKLLQEDPVHTQGQGAGEGDHAEADTTADPVQQYGTPGEPSSQQIADEGLRRLAANLGGAGHAGEGAAPRERVAGYTGLKVAQNLVPRSVGGSSPNDAAAGSPMGAEGAGAAQTVLQGMSAVETAYQQLAARLQDFGDLAGIMACVLPCQMPYGFYCELPAPGVLGDTPEDYGVQAWWFLANLSGQLNVSNYEATLPDGTLCLPDTGEEGFRAALASEELWPVTVQTRLGGHALVDAWYFLAILGDPAHPLSDAAHELLNACRQFNAVQHLESRGESVSV